MNAYSLTSHTKRFSILFSYQTSCRICLPVIRLPFKFPLINFSNGYGGIVIYEELARRHALFIHVFPLTHHRLDMSYTRAKA